MRRHIGVTAALALGLVVGGGVGVAARQSHPTQVRLTTHVVRAGETLWGIAERADPSRDPRAEVDRLMRQNGLSTPLIEVGQVIEIPAS